MDIGSAIATFLKDNAASWGAIATAVVVTATSVYGVMFWFIKQQKELLKQQQDVARQLQESLIQQLASSNARSETELAHVKYEHRREIEELKHLHCKPRRRTDSKDFLGRETYR